ncbi:MAG: 5'-3' exonuclease, partial [Patescibacteria group bacterium]
RLQPSHVVVAFDEKGPTFRHQQYEEYKASRPKMDEDLANQIGRTKEVVTALNIPQFSIAGFEADDVLGTLAKQAEMKGFDEIVIVTGDKDALQLISKKIHIYFPSRGKKPEQLYNREKFINEYGFEPKLLIDFKALAGDASDEIPGVSRIGPKTATDLITRFGEVEEIYEHLGEITSTTRQKLEKDKEMAFLSKKLATIETQVPIVFDETLSQLKEYDKEKVITLFETLEFRSLIGRLPSDSWEEMVEETLVKEAESSKKKSEEENKNQMKLF